MTRRGGQKSSRAVGSRGSSFADIPPAAPGSDDSERDQDDEQQGDKAPENKQEVPALLRLHVRDVVAGEEKRDIGRDEDGQHAPPPVDPDEGVVARPGKEGLEEREEQRHLQRDGELAADALFSVFGEIARAAVLRHHFEGDDAREGEHHRQLPAHADEQDEGRRGVGDRPERIAEDVADDRVADLVEPVHAVEREAGADRLVVLFVDLAPVDVEHDGEDKNKGPVEVFRAPHADRIDKAHGLLRAVSPEFEHIAPSFLFLFHGFPL